jgi:nucleoid DNA-binding protein
VKLSDLIHAIWKDERIKQLGLRKSHVRIIMDVVLEKISDGLMNFGKVKLQGLFTLTVRKIKGHNIRDLKNGGLMCLEDYHKVVIEARSKELKDKLKNFK